MTKSLEKIIEEMKQIGIFNGTFDAKNGSWEFMHGIACVMAYLAYEVSEDYGEKFSEEFFENMQKSIDKAKR